MYEPTYQITTRGDFLVDGEVNPCTAVLQWSLEEPALIRLNIAGPHNSADWLIGREMVAGGLETDGLYGHRGADVLVGGRINGALFCMVLTSPDGKAYVRIPRGDVVDFLSWTNDECGIGSENEQLILDNIVDELVEVSRTWTL